MKINDKKKQQQQQNNGKKEIKSSPGMKRA